MFHDVILGFQLALLRLLLQCFLSAEISYFSPDTSTNSSSGGVIVTPDFLKTLNLEGPSHTSLIGTVTALYDVG